MLTECLNYIDRDGVRVRRFRTDQIGSWIEHKESVPLQSRTCNDALHSLHGRNRDGKRIPSWKTGVCGFVTDRNRTVELYYRWTCETKPLDEEVLRQPLYNVQMYGCLLAIALYAREWALVEDDLVAKVRRYYVIPRDHLPEPRMIEVLAGPLEFGPDDLVQFYSCGMVQDVDRWWARLDDWTPVAKICGRYYRSTQPGSLFGGGPHGTSEMIVFTLIEEGVEVVQERPDPEPKQVYIDPGARRALGMSEGDVQAIVAGESVLVGKSDEELLRDCRALLHDEDAKLDPWTLAIIQLFRDPLKHLTQEVTGVGSLAYVKAFGALRRIVYDELLPALWQKEVSTHHALLAAAQIVGTLVVKGDGNGVYNTRSFGFGRKPIDQILYNAYHAANRALD